ncbi:MAG: T9SS type A sorting domain-containing protein, partial [Paludibacter sp.]
VITGTNLTGASAVSFGGTAATSYTVDSDTQITAIVATGTSGSVSVTTTGGTGTKTGFTYVAAPTITSFTPTSAGNGANVVITGTNLTGASAISFGGTAATSYNVDSDTQITAVVAAGTSGSVSVTTTGGTGTKTGFTYVAAPVTVVVNTLNPTLASLNLTTSSDITIKSTGTLTVNAPITVNSIALDSVGNLNVVSGNTVAVGTLTLKAGKTNSFSAKIDETITATTLRFVKTMDDTKWYFMSFPCNVVVADIISINGGLGTYGASGSWFIKEYNGAQRAISGTSTPNWSHVLSTATLAAKQGYIFGLADGMGTKDVIFPLATTILAKEEADDIPVTAHTGAAGGNNYGWNLVGQPYLSKFTGSGAGINFMVFSDGISNYTQYSKFSATKPLPSIDPFAAYFVQVDNSNPISFALANRQGAPAIVNSLSDIVDLNISSAGGTDNTTIIMDNDQSTAYQIGQDLEKWMSTGTQVYTVLGGINYAYNALPMSSVNNLAVGIYTKTAGTTTISANASQAQSLSKLLLTDNSTSPATVTDLLVSNYTFTAAAGTNNTRFAITAHRITTENVIEIGTNAQFIITPIAIGAQLIINNLVGNEVVRVFDALGRMVISKTANGSSLEIKLGARGIYTVQVQSGSTISTRKVIF